MKTSFTNTDHFFFKILRGIVFCIPFFLFIAITQWPFRHLPFWNDSLGYMIHNTHWMMENGSLFHPPYHDPGHHPMPFWGLYLFWMVFGTDVIVSHIYMWLNAVVLATGVYQLCKLVTNGNARWGIFGTVIVLTYPYFFSSNFLLTPDVLMVGCFVWMLYHFYNGNRMMYALCFALLTWSKANSYFIIFCFAAIEFGILPLIQFLYFTAFERKQLVKELGKWWVQWINASIIGGIPILVWLLISRIHQGFWFVSDIFKNAYDYDLTLQGTWERMTNGIIAWSFWSGEGNKVIVAFMVTLLVLMAVYLLATGKRHFFSAINRFGKANFSRAIRPRSFIAVSFGVQLFALLIIFGLKIMVVHRHFMPSMILLLILAVMAAFVVTQGIAYALQQSKWRASPAVRFIPISVFLFLLIALTGNNVVRWHPNYAAYLPIPRKYSDLYFRNWSVEGYEWNLQFISYLNVTEEAINYLEDLHVQEPEAVILSAYPYNTALRTPEAGFLKEGKPIPTQDSYSHTRLDSNDWRWLIHSTNTNSGDGTYTIDEIGKRDDIRVLNVFEDPNDDWDYQVVIFEKIR